MNSTAKATDIRLSTRTVAAANAAVHNSPTMRVASTASGSRIERKQMRSSRTTKVSDSAPARPMPVRTARSSSCLSAGLPVRRMVTPSPISAGISAAMARIAPIACRAGLSSSKSSAISTRISCRDPERLPSPGPNISPIQESAPGARRDSASIVPAIRCIASARPASPLPSPSSIRFSTASESMSARPRMLRSCQTVPMKGCAATIRSAVSSISSTGSSNSPLRRKKGSPWGWNTDRNRSRRRAMRSPSQSAARSACSGVAPSTTATRSRA